MRNNSKYLDQHLEPSRTWWKISQASSDGTQVITTHNGYTFTISNDCEIDWRAQISSQEKTSRMWLLSLGFLVRTWGENNPASTAALLSFHKFIGDQSNAEFVYTIASSDHCAATRLRTMCFILSSEDTDESVVQIALDIVRRDCEWIMSTPDAMPVNNHGMMVATALLHVCAVADIDIRDTLAEKAKKFFENMFAEVFDKNGFCNENTIGYHDFYRKSLTQLRNFANDFGVTDIANLIDAFLPKIEEALYKSVWNSGSIPPIGDSGVYLTEFKSIPGLHNFDTGLTVWKDGQTYLSVICGSLTETHKHMDDTSITLRHLDTDLIIDCGSYIYDWNDPYRQCLTSQRGHSGLAIEEFDPMPRGNFYRKFGETYTASSTILSEAPPSIRCDIEIKSKDISATREVGIASPLHIVVKDKFPAKHSGLQRFIIPASAFVTVVGKDILVQNGEISMWIETSTEQISVVKGQKEPVYKGWASTKFGEIAPAYCVEIRQGEKSSLETNIRFGTGEGGKPQSLSLMDKLRLSVRGLFKQKIQQAG